MSSKAVFILDFQMAYPECPLLTCYQFSFKGWQVIFWLPTHKVTTFYSSYICVGKYLSGFDMVTVMDKELSSLKETATVSQHPKGT